MIIHNLGINFAGGGGSTGGTAVLTSDTFTSNNTYTPPTGVDGYSAVTVNVDTVGPYNSGYTEGIAYRESLLGSETFTTNGSNTRPDGLSAITINVDTVGPYNSGVTDGMAAQKALLTSTAITENGSYTSENGFSAVTVDVQAGGENRLNSFFTNTLTAVTQSDLSGATQIRDYGFYGCSNLNTVDLPASVKTLYQSAFRASGIETLDVSNVTTYGSSVFQDCKSLTGLTGFENYTGQPQTSMFDGCTALTGDFRTNMTPGSYTNFNKLFKDCKNLRSVTWLKNQTEVTYSSASSNAYAGCTSMEYLDYTHNIQVPQLRFANPFTAFTANYEIRVPQILYDSWTAATNWSNSAIVGHIKAYPNPYTNVKLKYTTTGSDITPIVAYTDSAWNAVYIGTEFDAVTGGTVTLYGNVTIPNNTYSGMTSITSFEIQSGVTSIGSNVFNGCTSLSSVTIPDSVTSIDGQVFMGCTSLSSVTIPDSVITIGGGAFRGCTSLLSVTIPSGVTSIDSRVFNGCTSLSSVTIPDSVTTIAQYTFDGCTSLSSITIPSGVTSIGMSSFESCSRLSSITCNANVAPTLGPNVFSIFIMPTNGTLFVPAGSDYSSWLEQLPSGWRILPNTYADCQITTTAASETVKIGYTYNDLAALADVLVDGVSVKSSLVDDTYTFADAGTHIVRYVYTSSTATLATEQTDIESYSASTAVNEIGNYALSMTWGSSKLASIYLPNVTSIRKQSINNVIATDIYAPKIQTIGNKGLQFNNLLDPVSIPLTGVTSIGDNAFRQTAIKEAHFGSGLTTWNYNVFNQCASLSALTFDANTTGLTTMPSVGYETTSLLEVTYPDCVQTYGQNASYGLFSGSTALTGVTFGSGTTEFLGPLFDSSMSAVTEIKCYATTAPIIQSGWMGGVTASTGTLYVPAGSDYSTWATELGSNWTVSDTL